MYYIFEKPNIGLSKILKGNLLRNKRIYKVFQVLVL